MSEPSDDLAAHAAQLYHWAWNDALDKALSELAKPYEAGTLRTVFAEVISRVEALKRPREGRQSED